MGRKKTGKTPVYSYRIKPFIAEKLDAIYKQIGEDWTAVFEAMITKWGDINVIQKEISVIQKPPDPPTPPEPKVYGRADINECIAFLERSLKSSLDGTKAKNRQFCTHLINKMKKDYPDKEPVAQIKAIIIFGRKDSFHGKNMTSFEYIYKNTQKIIEAVKSQKMLPVRNLIVTDPNV